VGDGIDEWAPIDPTLGAAFRVWVTLLLHKGKDGKPGARRGNALGLLQPYCSQIGPHAPNDGWIEIGVEANNMNVQREATAPWWFPFLVTTSG